MSPRSWLARVRPFVLHPRRRLGQGPYWSSVRDESEPCGWLNTIISKMWPVYDHPVCTCASPSLPACPALACSMLSLPTLDTNSALPFNHLDSQLQ